MIKAFFLKLIKDLIYDLIKWGWEYLDEQKKNAVAAEQIKKHVEAVEDVRQQNFREWDERISQLEAQGQKMSKPEKDKFREQRIKNELDLWNTKP